MNKKEREALDWHAIREEVFMQEQGFQNEFDDIDEIAEHVVLYSEEMAIGCGRVYPDAKRPSSWHLGRLAIRKRYRNCGYGRVLVMALETRAQDHGAQDMQLSAQVQAIPFYERCGYQCVGEIFLDEHVPHQMMQKRL